MIKLKFKETSDCFEICAKANQVVCSPPNLSIIIFETAT